MTRAERIILALRMGPRTSMQLIEAANVADLHGAVKEARKRGARIRCRFMRKSRLGSRVYVYELDTDDRATLPQEPPPGPWEAWVKRGPAFAEYGAYKRSQGISDRNPDGSLKWWAR